MKKFIYFKEEDYDDKSNDKVIIINNKNKSYYNLMNEHQKTIHPIINT